MLAHVNDFVLFLSILIVTFSLVASMHLGFFGDFVGDSDGDALGGALGGALGESLGDTLGDLDGCGPSLLGGDVVPQKPQVFLHFV